MKLSEALGNSDQRESAGWLVVSASAMSWIQNTDQVCFVIPAPDKTTGSLNIC